MDPLVEAPRLISQVETTLIPEEAASISKGDLRLCSAWFRLARDLDLAKVVRSDPEMRAPGLHAHFAKKMREQHIIKVVTTQDFDAMMSCFSNFPEFTDSYLSNLVASHIAEFPGKGVRKFTSTSPDRLHSYASVTRQAQFETSMTWSALWRRNPAIFESRVTALTVWMDRQLNSAADVLDAVRSLKDGKEETAKQFALSLGKAGHPLFGVQTPFAGPPKPTAPLTEQQLRYLAEFNSMFSDPDKKFAVDNVALQPLLKSLKQGDWKPALESGLLRYALENLRGASLVIEDYAGRHPDEKLLESLARIKARVQEMQRAAERIESGKETQ